jgi:hypothetical protein
MFVLSVLPALWLAGASAFAGEAVSPQFNEERAKQEQIYHSTGDQRPEGYVIDRTLASYKDALSAGFDALLTALGAKDRWLDIGAGEGQAIIDYVTPAMVDGRAYFGGPAQAVAMSIEDRRKPVWHQTASTIAVNRISYLANKRLRDYAPGELGRFRLITDVIGGFSYVENLTLFMEKVLGILELNGSFFTVLQDVQSEAGTNKPYYANAPYLTTLKRADGSDITVCAWLRSISCVAVTCELKSGWRPPIENYSIRKTCDEVRVPALSMTHFAAGTPPERVFRLER